MSSLTSRSLVRQTCKVALICALFPSLALAQRFSRGSARASVNVDRSASVNRDFNRNVNVDRNVNVNQNFNRNIDVDRDVDVDVDHHYGGWGYGCCYHPVAAATAAAVTTAAVVGSIVHSLPPSCTTVSVNGLTYQQCGSTWYQPQFVGSTVNYIVVNPPR